MSLSIAKSSFIKAKNEIEKTRKKDYEVIALDAMALLKSRNINQGKNADGENYEGYSEAVVPYWFFGSQDGVEQTDLDKLKERGYFASYLDLREVKGLPTNIKNFTFTGKMWKGLIPVVVDSGKGIVLIDFETSSDRQDILEIHDEQSDVLELSKAELNLILKLANDRIQRIFRKNKL